MFKSIFFGYRIQFKRKWEYILLRCFFVSLCHSGQAFCFQIPVLSISRRHACVIEKAEAISECGRVRDHTMEPTGAGSMFRVPNHGVYEHSRTMFWWNMTRMSKTNSAWQDGLLTNAFQPVHGLTHWITDCKVSYLSDALMRQPNNFYRDKIL